MKKNFITILLINLANCSEIPRLKDNYQLGAFADVDFRRKPAKSTLESHLLSGDNVSEPLNAAQFLGLPVNAWKEQLDETDFQAKCTVGQKPKFNLMHALFLLKGPKKVLSAEKITKLLYNADETQVDGENKPWTKAISPEAAYLSAHVFSHNLAAQVKLLQAAAGSELPEIRFSANLELSSLQEQIAKTRDLELIATGKSKIIEHRAAALRDFLATSNTNMDATIEAVRLLDAALVEQKVAIIERLGIHSNSLDGARKDSCQKIVAEIIEAESALPEVMHAGLKVILANTSNKYRYLNAISLLDNSVKHNLNLRIFKLLQEDDFLRQMPTAEIEAGEKETFNELISFHQANGQNQQAKCTEIAAKIKLLADQGSKSACTVYGKLLLFFPSFCLKSVDDDNLHLALYYLTQVSDTLPNINSVIARILVSPSLKNQINFQAAIDYLKKGLAHNDEDCKGAVIDFVIHQELDEFRSVFSEDTVQRFIDEFKRSDLPEIKAKAYLDNGQNYYIKYQCNGNKLFETKFLKEWTEGARLFNCNAINKLAGYYLHQNQFQKCLAYLTDHYLSQIKNIKILNNCELIKIDALQMLKQEEEVDKLLCKAIRDNRNPYLLLAAIDKRMLQIKDTDSDYVDRLDDCLHLLIEAQVIPAQYKAQDYVEGEKKIKITILNSVKKLVKQAITNSDLKPKVLLCIEQLIELGISQENQAECQKWQKLLTR